MKLVDYESDDQEQQEQQTQQPKQKTLLIGLDKLNKLAQAKTTNDRSRSRSLSKGSDDEPDQPLHQNDPQKRNVMILSKPKQQIKQTKQNTMPRHRIPPPPPGVSYAEASDLIKKLTKEDMALVDEFDKDDMFMQDQKTLLQKGAVKAQQDEDGKYKTISDQNDKYWEMQREKIISQQEAYMKVPTQVDFTKREKNQIDALHYQAVLKQENYDSRKQQQKTSKDKKNARYGW